MAENIIDNKAEEKKSLSFVEQIVEKDLEEGKNIKNQKLMGRKKKSPIGIPQENNLKSHR